MSLAPAGSRLLGRVHDTGCRGGPRCSRGPEGTATGFWGPGAGELEGALAELALELLDLVTQAGRFFEAQIR